MEFSPNLNVSSCIHINTFINICIVMSPFVLNEKNSFCLNRSKLQMIENLKHNFMFFGVLIIHFWSQLQLLTKMQMQQFVYFLIIWIRI